MTMPGTVMTFGKQIVLKVNHEEHDHGARKRQPHCEERCPSVDKVPRDEQRSSDRLHDRIHHRDALAACAAPSA
jgi:hypothetical protein